MNTLDSINAMIAAKLAGMTDSELFGAIDLLDRIPKRSTDEITVRAMMYEEIERRHDVEAIMNEWVLDLDSTLTYTEALRSAVKAARS